MKLWSRGLGTRVMDRTRISRKRSPTVGAGQRSANRETTVVGAPATAGERG